MAAVDEGAGAEVDEVVEALADDGVTPGVVDVAMEVEEGRGGLLEALGKEMAERGGVGEAMLPVLGHGGRREDGVVAEEEQGAVGVGGEDGFGAVELGEVELAARGEAARDAGVEGEEVPAGGEVECVGIGRGHPVGEELLHLAAAGGGVGVAVVVAGEDERGDALEERVEDSTGEDKFRGQSGGGQVAGDQDVVGFEGEDAADDPRKERVVEFVAAAEPEVELAEHALTQQAPWGDGQGVEVDVAEDDETGHRGAIVGSF